MFRQPPSYSRTVPPCPTRRSADLLCGAGPVEPLQLPSALKQTTCHLSVSIGLPGPTIAAHQPGAGLAALAAAWASGDRPVRIRMVLSPAALRVPQVS